MTVMSSGLKLYWKENSSFWNAKLQPKKADEGLSVFWIFRERAILFSKYHISCIVSTHDFFFFLFLKISQQVASYGIKLR